MSAVNRRGGFAQGGVCVQTPKLENNFEAADRGVVFKGVRETAPRPPWNPTATSRGRNIRGGGPARTRKPTIRIFPLPSERAVLTVDWRRLALGFGPPRVPSGCPVRSSECPGAPSEPFRVRVSGVSGSPPSVSWPPESGFGGAHGGPDSPYSPVVGRRPCRGGSPRRLLRASSPSMWGARDAQNRQNVVCHFPRTPFLAHPPF